MHGRDSSAGTATSHRLDGPGSISRYFQFFIRSVFSSITSLCINAFAFCTSYVNLCSFCITSDILYYFLYIVYHFLYILYYFLYMMYYFLNILYYFVYILYYFCTFCITFCTFCITSVLCVLLSVHSVLLSLILYSVLLMYYCLRILHCLCNTASMHRPNCSS
jgi:hypothetical protein